MEQLRLVGDEEGGTKEPERPQSYTDNCADAPPTNNPVVNPMSYFV